MSANVYSFIYFSIYACYLCDKASFYAPYLALFQSRVICSLVLDYLGAGTSVMLGFGDYRS